MVEVLLLVWGILCSFLIGYLPSPMMVPAFLAVAVLAGGVFCVLDRRRSAATASR